MDIGCPAATQPYTPHSSIKKEKNKKANQIHIPSPRFVI